MTKKDLTSASTEDLIAELKQRSPIEMGQEMQDIEEGLEAKSREIERERIAAWLSHMAHEEGESKQPCPRCGRLMRVKVKKRKRHLRTLGGEIVYARNYHWCTHCHYGFYPLDQKAGIPEKGEATKSVVERVMDFAVNTVETEAADRFSYHYGQEISPNFIRRIIDRIELPEKEPEILIKEHTKRLTVEVDGSMIPMRAGWQEAKLGVLVCEEHHLKSDKHQRGMVSEAHYVGTLGKVEQFEQKLHETLPTVNIRSPLEIVWVADGARWIWEMAKRLCPHALQILDWIHALEHGLECGKVLLEDQADVTALWEQRIRSLLWEGKIEQLLMELNECLSICTKRSPLKRDKLVKLINYYESNKSRMDYKNNRDNGRIIGSGIIESAHKHVIQTRMKRAGQHWSEEGAEKMIQLRTRYKTYGPRQFSEELWKLAA